MSKSFEQITMMLLFFISTLYNISILYNTHIQSNLTKILYFYLHYVNKILKTTQMNAKISQSCDL